MKSILKLLFAILIASTSAFFIVVENAEVVEAVCKIGELPVLQSDGWSTKCENPTTSDNSEEKVDGIKNYMMSFTKVVMVFSTSLVALTITYAGFLYVTSEGSPLKVDMAKRMLMRSGIGVLVVASSFIILTLLENTIGIS